MDATKKKSSIITGVATALVLSVSFGLIACFANTQSIVEILLAGSISAMYAARSGAMIDWLKIFDSRYETMFSTCIGWVNSLIELIIRVLSVISTFGLIFGFIEPSFVNIFLPTWIILMDCIGFFVVPYFYKKISEFEEREDYHENKEIDY